MAHLLCREEIFIGNGGLKKTASIIIWEVSGKYVEVIISKDGNLEKLSCFWRLEKFDPIKRTGYTCYFKRTFILILENKCLVFTFQKPLNKISQMIPKTH